MEQTKMRRCSTVQRLPTAVQISSRAAMGDALTVAGYATMTTTAVTVRMKVKTATHITRRARRVSLRARTSSVSGTRTGATAKMIAATIRTSSDVRWVVETGRRPHVVLTSSGAPAGSASMQRWCATKFQTARTIATSQPIATWTNAPGSNSTSALIGASTLPLGSRASAMRDISSWKMVKHVKILMSVWKCLGHVHNIV